MDYTIFKNTIKEIYEFFRYKDAPLESTINNWFYKVEFIPDIAIPWIKEQLEELDSIPRNIPKLFKKYWFDYQRTHKDKIVHIKEKCDDCHGLGYHYFSKLEYIYNPPMRNTYIARCASCQNWKNVFGRDAIENTRGHPDWKPIEAYTKQQIIDNGWKFVPHDGTGYQKFNINQHNI